MMHSIFAFVFNVKLWESILLQAVKVAKKREYLFSQYTSPASYLECHSRNHSNLETRIVHTCLKAYVSGRDCWVVD